jgi:hypothetical protein
MDNDRKGLKIHVKQVNEAAESSETPIHIKHQCSNAGNSLISNMCGYLWKFRTDSTPLNNQLNNKTALNTTSLPASIIEQQWSSKFDKCWFSLNQNLSCLIYWRDKYEQDLGKFPVGKLELTKCCSIKCSSDILSDSSDQQQLEFRIIFHQNPTNAVILRANCLQNKLSWCEALKHTIESISGICAKCKPKLIVNPMPLPQSPQSSSLSTTNQTTNAQQIDVVVLNSNANPVNLYNNIQEIGQQVESNFNHVNFCFIIFRLVTMSSFIVFF